MTVLVDIGNSMTQWCGVTNGQLGPVAACQTPSFSLAMLPTSDRYVVASVVPQSTALFANQSGCLFVSSDTIPDIHVGIPEPQQVGADRLATALAGYRHAQGACLVIDSGTATTLCYVNVEGTYQGGVILPGLALSAKALHRYTAQLPDVWVEPTDSYCGQTTQEAIQIGLYRSAVYTLSGFISAYRDSHPGIAIIGTGTGMTVLHDALDLDYFDPHLIFQGLAAVGGDSDIMFLV